MTRTWALRSIVAAGAALGIFLLFAFALQIPAVGRTMGSPQACGTCHVMTYEVVTLERSSHSQLTCLDCHAPSGFLEKPVEEIRSASRHLYIFMLNATPDIIKPQHSSREIVQSQCVQCHASISGSTAVHKKDFGRYCFDCHREVPHGTPLRN